MADSFQWVLEQQQQGTRNQPLSDATRRYLEAAGAATGLRAEVFSGGQPTSGPGRTGSHRHDLGGAADIHLRDLQTNRLLDMRNDADRARMAEYVKAAASAGATGIGGGVDYMGGTGLHIGGGTPAVWGAGGRSANAPGWLRQAVQIGPSRPGISPPVTGSAAAPQAPAKPSIWSALASMGKNMAQASQPQPQVQPFQGMQQSGGGMADLSISQPQYAPAPLPVWGGGQQMAQGNPEDERLKQLLAMLGRG